MGPERASSWAVDPDLPSRMDAPAPAGPQSPIPTPPRVDSVLPPDLLGLALRSGGVFTTSQAVAHGLTHERLRRAVERGEIERVGRGIYADRLTYAAAQASPFSAYDLRAAAAVTRLRRACLVSHESAAAVWRLSLLDDPPARIRVTRPAQSRTGTQWQAAVRITHASLPVLHRRIQRGIPITSVGRTVVDLARSLPFREAVVVADSALRQRLVSRGGLSLVLLDCAHWPGAPQATTVIRFADDRAESPLESISRAIFYEYGLPAPDLQVWLGDEPARHRVDFLWRKQRTIGEADGRGKYVQPADLWKEKRRQDALNDLGYEVTRWTWEIEKHPVRVVERINQTFSRAARRFHL